MVHLKIMLCGEQERVPEDCGHSIKSRDDASMSFENLTVNRLIIHEVFRRGDDKQRVPPVYGQQLVHLDQDAMDAFRDRVLAALGSQSQAMEMTIAKHDDESAWSISADLVGANDRAFVTGSQRFADKLADVQVGRNLPGGIVVVFSGTAGHPAKRVVGVIKAEPHSGFTRQVSNGAMGLAYLKELILTPQAKLYKLGAFIERDPAKAQGDRPWTGWKAHVYDSHIVGSDKDGAAQYFVELFLGLAQPKSNARKTKQFYDFTKDFIRTLDISEEDKTDLFTGLYTYLKVDQARTVETQAFANNYLPDVATRDAYRAFMAEQKFPTTAVSKDLAELTSALRQRRITFNQDVRLTAPADRFKELISIEEFDGEADANGEVPRWTRITVHDRIKAQE